jgi:3-oxoacid CoA-transferase subunit A
MERGIVADIALVHAHTADLAGNLTYRYSARNFNPVVATAGRFTIVEAEVILTESYIDPNIVITPGIFVQRLVAAKDREKEIEQRTVRPRPTQASKEF